MLSKARKYVLIKAKLTKIPMFLTNSTKIPKYIVKEIDCKNRDFSEEIVWIPIIPCTIRLIYWDKICRSKCECGLQVRKTRDINAALLAKLG